MRHELTPRSSSPTSPDDSTGSGLDVERVDIDPDKDLQERTPAVDFGTENKIKTAHSTPRSRLTGSHP